MTGGKRQDAKEKHLWIELKSIWYFLKFWSLTRDATLEKTLMGKRFPMSSCLKATLYNFCFAYNSHKNGSLEANYSKNTTLSSHISTEVMRENTFLGKRSYPNQFNLTLKKYKQILAWENTIKMKINTYTDNKDNCESIIQHKYRASKPNPCFPATAAAGRPIQALWLGPGPVTNPDCTLWKKHALRGEKRAEPLFLMRLKGPGSDFPNTEACN